MWPQHIGQLEGFLGGTYAIMGRHISISGLVCTSLKGYECRLEHYKYRVYTKLMYIRQIQYFLSFDESTPAVYTAWLLRRDWAYCLVSFQLHLLPPTIKH